MSFSRELQHNKGARRPKRKNTNKVRPQKTPAFVNAYGRVEGKRHNGNVIRVHDDGVFPILPLFVSYGKSIQLATSAAQVDFDFTVGMFVKFLSMCVSTTLAYAIPYAIRLRRVRIWACAPTLGSTTTIGLEWNAGSTGFLLDGMSESATTCSTTEPACIDCRPPHESLAGWYQAIVTGNSNIIFSVTCPGGSTIRLDYDFVINGGEGPNPPSGFAVTGGTQGLVFAQNPSSSIVVTVPANSLT